MCIFSLLTYQLLIGITALLATHGGFWVFNSLHGNASCNLLLKKGFFYNEANNNF